MAVKKHYISSNLVESLPSLSTMAMNRTLRYAGIERWESWLGNKVLLLIFLFVIALLLPFSLVPFVVNNGLANSALLEAVASFPLHLKLAASLALAITLSGVYLSIIYFYISIRRVNRGNEADKILPDFLLMVAANIRAGMTPFQAFKSAARPEFGPLEEEIKRIATRSLGIDSFTDALRQIGDSIDSKLLRMTTKYFEQGLKSGGRLADLLETSASEIREMQELKRELALSTKTYMIFLAFIVILGLPMMLSVSTQFLKSFPKFDDATSMPGSVAPPKITISPDFVQMMGYVAIFLTTFSVSLVIGIIGEGKFFYGIRYFPALLVVTLIAYVLIQAGMSAFLGGMSMS